MGNSLKPSDMAGRIVLTAVIVLIGDASRRWRLTQPDGGDGSTVWE